MSTSATPALTILEVVDAPARVTGTGRKIAPELLALVEALPPHPKWAVVRRGASQRECSAIRSRLQHVNKVTPIEFTIRQGAVFVRRRADPTSTAPAEQRVVVKFEAAGDADAVKSAVTKALKVTKAAPATEPAVDDTPPRPKVIGWIGMSGSKRMAVFVDAYKAHGGDLKKVAAELDCSTNLADAWRRNAKTQGLIR